MTVEETQGQAWPDMGSMTVSRQEWRWGSGHEHEKTWKLNTEEGDWWVSAAEGRNTGDVDEADGRAGETKENMAQTKD